ncbi:phospholipase D family protein [Herbaspirillum sp. HC18]|nr:phospholipase D family protein [Herbaspirillum sp. HC18]
MPLESSLATSRCRAALAALLLVLLCGCASLPANSGRTPSYALMHTADTRLGQSVAAVTAANSGMDGIYALPSGRDAFAMRIVLVAAAQRSLDLQYYIWKNDTTGQLMLEQVWKAAERGVRVRLLLDDQQTRGLDAILATLDAHPNIEVRLFNPYANRGFRVGDIALDFSRINRRMHNKSFVADNQVAILGGRNIGNEYFGADVGLDYSDLDVAAVGPLVRGVSGEFDLYWNSESAYPAASVISPVDADEAKRVREEWGKPRQDPEAQEYIESVRNTPLLRLLEERRLPLEWTHARVVYDRPEKVLQPPDQVETHMLPHMEAVMGRPMSELDLVSPYFVPGKEGTKGLAALQARGVRVRVLTNSLAATDVSPVHAGYKKYRVELLRNGVTLYEIKPSALTIEQKETREDEDKASHRVGSSSSAALHAKTFAVDRSRIFVGSFNLDPRSLRLNTEMGAVIESPVLAGRLADVFEKQVENIAYRVRLAADGHNLEWIEHTDEGDLIYTHEPQTGLLRRMWAGFLSILPIESLL